MSPSAAIDGVDTHTLACAGNAHRFRPVASVC